MEWWSNGVVEWWSGGVVGSRDGLVAPQLAICYLRLLRIA